MMSSAVSTSHFLSRIMPSMVCNDARCATPMFPSSCWMAFADDCRENDGVDIDDDVDDDAGELELATKKLFWLCLCGPFEETAFLGRALGLRRMVLEAFIVLFQRSSE